ncbi:MAG: hypothetical protein ABIQ60_01810 [Burkholderiaceae bacterium]
MHGLSAVLSVKMGLLQAQTASDRLGRNDFAQNLTEVDLASRIDVTPESSDQALVVGALVKQSAAIEASGKCARSRSGFKLPHKRVRHPFVEPRHATSNADRCSAAAAIDANARRSMTTIRMQVIGQVLREGTALQNVQFVRLLLGHRNVHASDSAAASGDATRAKRVDDFVEDGVADVQRAVRVAVDLHDESKAEFLAASLELVALRLETLRAPHLAPPFANFSSAAML